MWETEKNMQDKYPRLFIDSITTLFLPQPIYPKFVTQGRVMGKLLSIVTIEFCHYRKVKEKNFRSKNFFVVLEISQFSLDLNEIIVIKVYGNLVQFGDLIIIFIT